MNVSIEFNDAPRVTSHPAGTARIVVDETDKGHFVAYMDEAGGVIERKRVPARRLYETLCGVSEG